MAMHFSNLFTRWMWIWDLLIGVLTILGYFGVKKDLMLNYINQLSSQSVLEYALLIVAIFFFIRAIQLKSGGRNKSEIVLKDIANGKKDKECALWDYGKFGFSGVPFNDTWKEWIQGLVITTDRPDLDYYNFGEEFYFFDLSTGNKIKIPTGDKVRKEKVSSSFYGGMVVRLMPQTP
jgi:hypothetical protein